MRCPKCGRETPDGSKVCMMCGERLSGTKKCPECGNEISVMAAYCPECGEQFNSASNRNYSSPAKAGKPRLKALAWIGFVLLALFALCYVPAPSGFVFLAAALLVMPIDSIQNSLRNVKISGAVKGVIVVLLFLVGALSAPTSDRKIDDRDNASENNPPVQSVSTELEDSHKKSEPEPDTQPVAKPDPVQDAPKASVEAGTPIYSEEDDDPDQIWASDFTPINEFYYTLSKSKNTITLNKYDGHRKKIMISPIYTINGTDYHVKALGDACFFGEISITSVYIPEGVTSISDNCFNSCSDLQYLYLPSTLKSVTRSFLDYINEYTIYCDSVASLPSERDMTDYEEKIDDRSQEYELGQSAAGAVNGLLAGLLDGASGTTTTTEIYFGGTENQWKSIRK